jgi:predicted NAD-dependent protein-ADP-ribosyltransferase YbiA (DUF1768 family)
MKIDENDHSSRSCIAEMTPHQAKSKIKKFKNSINLNEFNKLKVMEYALRHKWSQKPFDETLLNSIKTPIIEWNNWSDTYWGVDVKDCKGHNNLGLILMKIRKESYDIFRKNKSN